MPLKDLQSNGDEQTLRARLATIVNGLVRIFRQCIANDGFKPGPLTIRNVDLTRVHSIVNEIDSKGVFYTYYDDELPPKCVGSVQDVRKEIRTLSRGVWADAKQETLIQELQTAMGDFITASDRIDPFPKNHHDPKFGDFVSLLVDLRFRVWSVVAALKIKNGDVIQPAHLPPEILAAVESATNVA